MRPSTSAILKPDLCVIGAGRCGLAVASAARALGASVAIVEKDQMGGNHPHAARLMALAAAGRMAAEGARARRLGLGAAGVEMDVGRARAYAERIAVALARDMSRVRFEALGARVMCAAGRFAAKDTLEAGGLAIRARRFVVATGATPIIPPLPGLALVRYLTPRTILGLAELPRQLVILGGGASAVEIAQALRRLGRDVTLVASGRALPEIDGELAGLLLAELARDGVRIVQPAAESLARVLLRSALFETPLTRPRAIPVLVNGDPEIATIGLMEEAARSHHDKILISRAPFAATDRARIEGEPAGHVKLIAKKSGEILGAGIVGRGAGDLIVPFILAIARGLKAADLADFPLASAVRSAAAWQALAGLSGPGSRKRPLRRMLALAKRFR